jgi:hypothetical protein
MISRKQAIVIAIEARKLMPEGFMAQEGVPDRLNIYGLEKRSPKEVWFVSSSAFPGMTICGPSHITVIDKKTGEVLYDGLTNEE